jgi:ATP-binding cassette subfamily B protein
MIIVSHRLSSLVDCDQILVLDRGKVIDIGNHAALLEKCAIYRTLWNQQHRHMFNNEGSGHAALAPALLQGN